MYTKMLWYSCNFWKGDIFNTDEHAMHFRGHICNESNSTPLQMFILLVLQISASAILHPFAWWCESPSMALFPYIDYPKTTSGNTVVQILKHE